MFFMKKTINNSNKYFSTAKKKEKMIINAVYSSINPDYAIGKFQSKQTYYKI